MKKKYVINTHTLIKFIIYIFLLLPFFQIPYLYLQIPFLPKLYTISLFIANCIILLLLISMKKYKNINNYVILLMIVLLISTIVNGADISACIGLILRVVGLTFLCNYGISNDRKIFLKSFETLLSILIIINFITILAHPVGLYMNDTGYIENWFLGYKNSHILYFLPYILVSFLNSYIDYGKLKIHNIVMFIVIIMSTFLVNNSTAIIGLSIIALFLIFNKFIKKNDFFNSYTYLIIFIALFIFIVMLRFQEIFSFLIVDILNKDITFTGRIYVWDKAINYILEKPILGYGNVSFQYSTIVFSTHNMILGIFHKVGALGAAIFLKFIIKICQKLNKTKGELISKFISIILLTYFIMMTTEYYNFEYIIYIFIIAYYVDEFIRFRRNDYDKNIACK